MGWSSCSVFSGCISRYHYVSTLTLQVNFGVVLMPNGQKLIHAPLNTQIG